MPALLRPIRADTPNSIAVEIDPLISAPVHLGNEIKIIAADLLRSIVPFRVEVVHNGLRRGIVSIGHNQLVDVLHQCLSGNAVNLEFQFRVILQILLAVLGC